MQNTETNMNTNEKNASRYRRRRLVVNPTFQWRYAGLAMLGIFVVTAFMCMVLFGVLQQQARMRVLYPHAPGSWEYTFIIFISALAFSVVTAGAFGLFSMIFTHRMCGPLLVLGRWLDEVAQGRIPRLRPLRQKDEFQDLYASFAKAIETLRKNRQAEQVAVAEALAMARSALETEGNARKDALQSVANQLESLRNTVNDAIDPETAKTLAAMAAGQQQNDDSPADDM